MYTVITVYILILENCYLSSEDEVSIRKVISVLHLSFIRSVVFIFCCTSLECSSHSILVHPYILVSYFVKIELLEITEVVGI